MSSKQKSFWLCFYLLVFLLPQCAFAENFDVTSYSYDDLLVIREAVNDQILALERQYAIENGNRVISFAQPELTLLQGRTHKLEPSVRRVVEEAPETTRFVYSSSDEEIVKVSSEGKLTAVACGTATVTCTAKDDEYIFCELPVEVVQPVSAIVIPEEEILLFLKTDDTASAQALLSPTVEPANAYIQTYSFASSDEEVVTVDSSGHLLAVAPGNAKITVTTDEEPANGNKAVSVSCKVTVRRAVEEIQLEQSQLVLDKNSTHTLSAIVFPDEASIKTVTWSSSNPDVASVSSSGRISTKACGSCIITCEADDGSGVIQSCTLDVIQMVTSMSFDDKSITLNMERTLPLKVNISPSDATAKSVVWTSSDPSIVQVTNRGLITAIGGGNCTISCAATDGSNVSTSLSVYVPSIAVDKSEYTVTAKGGLTFHFSYYGRRNALEVIPSSTNTIDLRYEVKDNHKVAVSIIPKKYGNASITIKDANDSKSTRKLNISVEHSAVYDSVSYPKASYEDILRDPSAHYGDQIRISGRVVQKLQSGSTVVLRVATRRYDDVFYVKYSTNDVDARVIEDDRVTVYGVCLGDYTYETVMGASVTIPYMRAEKIEFNND